MLRRSELPVEDKKYMPIYRKKSFDQERRKISKMVESMTWFKCLELTDPYRNGWKAAIRNKQKGPRMKVAREKETVCAMFIPPSHGSELQRNILFVKGKLEGDMDWKVKLIEQSGIPLVMSFIPSFPLDVGCPNGAECSICGGTGMNCRREQYVKHLALSA